jgi:hypothetical protein
MKLKLCAPIAAIFLYTTIYAQTHDSGANPALHKLASILENEDSSLGAFARLYNQIDQINDKDNHLEDDLMDDTRTIGENPPVLKSAPARPDFDPAY